MHTNCQVSEVNVITGDNVYDVEFNFAYHNHKLRLDLVVDRYNLTYFQKNGYVSSLRKYIVNNPQFTLGSIASLLDFYKNFQKSLIWVVLGYFYSPKATMDSGGIDIDTKMSIIFLEDDMPLCSFLANKHLVNYRHRELSSYEICDLLYKFNRIAEDARSIAINNPLIAQDFLSDNGIDAYVIVASTDWLPKDMR